MSTQCWYTFGRRNDYWNYFYEPFNVKKMYKVIKYIHMSNKHLKKCEEFSYWI